MIIHGHAKGSVLGLAEVLEGCDVHLRWGGPKVPPEYAAVNGQITYLDGLQQLQAFSAAGVRCPRFTMEYTSVSAGGGWFQDRRPVYGRNRHHSQGKDILVVLKKRDGTWDFRDFSKRVPRPLRNGNAAWCSKDFFTEWTPSLREWRFHIIRKGSEYLSIGRALKVWTGTGPEPSGTDPLLPVVRSRRLGWSMIHDVDPPEGLRDLAKTAVAACKYDLGAVDVLELPSGAGMVLEVNSRPALRDPYTLTAYINALKAWRG